MLHKLKSACSIRKNQQVHLQVFSKSLRTNWQIPQFNWQPIPTTGTSNSKGSQTPIHPVARHNKIPANGRSQSRPTRNCWTLSAKSNKVSWSETLRYLNINMSSSNRKCECFNLFEILFVLAAFPVDIGRKPAMPARAPGEMATLKRRREPASPVMRHAG